nr:carbonic anhydrase [uncultured Sphingomonas sp.]
MDNQLSRRHLIGSALAAFGAIALPGNAAALGGYRPTCSTGGEDKKPCTPRFTPAQAFDRLRKGIFPAEGGKLRTRTPVEVDLTKTQEPFCALLSCSDSRVPPELIFGAGLGDLFIVRNAGNALNTAAIGSLEYAVAELCVPLIVVMGHEHCGAVEAALSVVETSKEYPGVIGNMLEPILPAAIATRNAPPGDARPAAERATRAHVSRMTAALRQRTDPLLLNPQKDGRLWVVGAYYKIGTNEVDFFDLPPGVALSAPG